MFPGSVKKSFAKSNHSYYESFMETTNMPKGRMRWWIPAIIVVIAIAAVIRVRASADLDGMIKNMRTMLALTISLPLLLIWWLFFTRLRWRTRLAGFGLLVLCLAGLKLLLRIDGAT